MANARIQRAYRSIEVILFRNQDPDPRTPQEWVKDMRKKGFKFKYVPDAN